jgi:type I restriction enzyme S subunit
MVMNKMKAWQGSIALSDFRGIVSPAYFVYRPTHEFSRKYFHYLMRSAPYIGEYNRISKGVRIGQWDLDPTYFRTTQLIVPPLEEQRAIADFLDRETAKIDMLIVKQEQLITTLDERRQAVISRAVTRGIIEGRPLHYSGVEWLGEIPTAWECKPVRSLMRFNSEKNTGYKSNNYLSLMANVGVILYEDKGAVGNKSPEDLEKCKIVRTGDFVLNSMNFGIGSFGVSPYDGVCSTVYVVMTPASKACSPSFLKHIFSMKPFQKHAQSLGDGILEHRAAIGWHDLKNLGFPVPPLEEQQAIADFLDRETAQIDELNAQAKRMTELFKERRQALISAAVTGKLEVSV